MRTLEPIQEFPVQLENKEIFHIKNRIGSFTPKQRADAISQRIEAIAEAKDFEPRNVILQNNGFYIDLLHNDVILFSVTEADAKSENMPLVALAEQRKTEIETALQNYEVAHGAQRLFFNGGIALILTVCLCIILFAYKYLFEYMKTKVLVFKERFIPHIRIKNFEILTSQRITRGISFAFKVLKLIAIVVTVYFYCAILFGLFPWTENWVPKLIQYVVTPLKHVAHVALDFIPNLFFILVIGGLTYYFLMFVKFIFSEIELGNLSFQNFHRDWAMPTYKLLRFFILALALIAVFPYLPGSSSPAFQGVSVFLGLLLSFGSSSAVSNMVAGIVLTYMRPFKLGDRVKIAETVGDVTEKTLLVTRVRTIKNVDITIPNSSVLNSHIINYSRSSENKEHGLILNTTVTVGYDIPWTQVHEVLKAAALKCEYIVQNPAPFVLQTQLNNSTVSYELNAYTHTPHKMAQIYSDLHQHIQDSFHEAEIELLSPIYNILRSENPNQKTP